jgi:deoxyhypusine synthase
VSDSTRKDLRKEVSVKDLVDGHYRHFNAASLRNASHAYAHFLKSSEKNKVLVALAGAMSTAELGVSLAEAIRSGVVSAISCTGANLEESLFMLVAKSKYVQVDYRHMRIEDEVALLERGLNRVTDTCIPEGDAIRVLEAKLLPIWQRAMSENRRELPATYFKELCLSGELEAHYEDAPENCWLLAAARADIPVFVAGWEDSTLGQIFSSYVWRGELDANIVKAGPWFNVGVMEWYLKSTESGYRWGFLEIGGGIAADSTICVVPSLRQDAEVDVPLWQLYIQLTLASESAGGYSGAAPSEKITWEKLEPTAPMFSVLSCATITAPIIFNYVVGELDSRRSHE